MTQPQTILVIDDEPQVREAMQQILQQHGYGVVAARNGREGISSVAASMPDLVITDLFMPESDGIGTIRALRKSHPDIPVIAISGGGPSGGDQYLRIARELGARASLQKPFSVHELLETVREALAGLKGPTSGSAPS